MTGRIRIDVADAAALIASNMPAYPATPLPLDDCAEGILREAVCAERDQPPFDRVTMDGIAIRHAAFAGGRREFRVVGTQAAGAAALSLGNDANCVEIMTGAALPADADTVIPVERIQRQDEVAILEPGYEPGAGQFVHRRGSDHAAGQPLLVPGVRLGPPEMAVLTISGKASFAIGRWPRLAVISTGDELVEPGLPIEPFQIRSSNDRAIVASLRRRGCLSATRARLPDEPAELRRVIAALHEAHDVLVLSGGVSMGKYDYVPQIMAELGVELVFHKVLQRPGLPMWFGVSADRKPVFALPGNPVSSLVCFVRYVAPAIERALGLARQHRERVRLAETVRFEPDLTWFLPVALKVTADGNWEAIPRPTNTSGDFVSLAGTDGFVELPRGQADFPAGFPAEFFPW
jgi:molybdopterin molybdotransferase